MLRGRMVLMEQQVRQDLRVLLVPLERRGQRVRLVLQGLRVQLARWGQQDRPGRPGRLVRRVRPQLSRVPQVRLVLLDQLVLV